MRAKICIFLVMAFAFSGCIGIINLGEIGINKNFGVKTIIPTTKPMMATQDGTNASADEDVHDEKMIITPGNDNQLQWQGPGEIFVPILLYHHILEHEVENIYSVNVSSFREQMSYLKENGYSTINTQQLAKAITEGANLPQKPVLITFDDGNENIYLNAYPVMKEFDLTGTVYPIANRLTAGGFLSVDQLNELIIGGWEVGSHGYTHVDLVEYPDALRNEIGESKKKLEEKLETGILTFAYSFGKASAVTKDWVKRVGYFSGMGLGIQNFHSEKDIWYLSRRQVNSDTTPLEFIQLLSYN